MVPTSPIFLLIDDNRDRRSLLVRTIRRKFPSAVVRECADAESALGCTREGIPDAVVVHRASEIEGVEMLTRIRKEDPSVPLVFLSVTEISPETIGANNGHTRFLNYDAWLNLGTVLAEMLDAAVEKKESAPV